MLGLDQITQKKKVNPEYGDGGEVKSKSNLGFDNVRSVTSNVQQDDPSFIERLGNSLSGWWNSNNSTRDTEELAAIKGSSLGYRMAEGKTKPTTPAPKIEYAPTLDASGIKYMQDMQYREQVSQQLRERDALINKENWNRSPQNPNNQATIEDSQLNLQPWYAPTKSNPSQVNSPKSNNAIQSTNDSRVNQSVLQAWLNPTKPKAAAKPTSSNGAKKTAPTIGAVSREALPGIGIPMIQDNRSISKPKPLSEEYYGKTMQEDGGPAINPESIKKSIEKLDNKTLKSLGARIKEKLGIKSK